jgi:uncharacterized protein (TIGR04255 family)
MIGIACSNEYSWDKFKNSIKRLVDILYSTHPTTDKIQIEIAMLGYENSIRYNPKMDFFNYIKEHLKTEIIIKDSMFDKHINSRESVDFGFFNLFPTTKPKGTFRYSIEKSDNNKNKLDWKAFVYSHNEDAPNNKKDIISWANDAHSLADDWYNKIIGK